MRKLRPSTPPPRISVSALFYGYLLFKAVAIRIRVEAGVEVTEYRTGGPLA